MVGDAAAVSVHVCPRLNQCQAEVSKTKNQLIKNNQQHNGMYVSATKISAERGEYHQEEKDYLDDLDYACAIALALQGCSMLQDCHHKASSVSFQSPVCFPCWHQPSIVHV